MLFALAAHPAITDPIADDFGDFGDFVAFENVSGLSGRLAARALRALFTPLGTAPIHSTRVTVAADGTRVPRSRLRKPFGLTATATTAPDGGPRCADWSSGWPPTSG